MDADRIDRAIAEAELAHRIADSGAIPPPVHPDPVLDEIWDEEARDLRAIADSPAPAPQRRRYFGHRTSPRSTPTSADRPNHEQGRTAPEGSTR